MFVIMDVSSVYNTLFRRPALDIIDWYVPTKHLRLKFTIECGKESVWGDLWVSMQLYYASRNMVNKEKNSVYVNDVKPKEITISSKSK